MSLPRIEPAAAVDARREAVRRSQNGLNGIDFVEVDPADASRLVVQFLRDLAADLAADMFQVSGGVRRRDIAVTGIDPPANAGQRRIGLTLDGQGDRSVYELVLAAPAAAAIDGQLAIAPFRFFPECDDGTDCRVQPAPPRTAAPPDGAYLGRDYPALRKLLLDRLSERLPGWTERNPADPLVTVAELLAYVGDQFAWRQDAVTTEASIATARLRSSVRRHARLMDYTLGEGAAARVWVRLRLAQGAGALAPVPAGTLLLTSMKGMAPTLPPNWPGLSPALAAGALAFELVETLDALHGDLDRLQFHAWGIAEFALQAGATEATLAGHHPLLAAGMVLVFAEQFGRLTGDPADADRMRRHAVRIETVGPPATDPLDGAPITPIAWHAEDALPFDLVVATVSEAGVALGDVSVAFGNIALAEHRRPAPAAELPPVPPTGRYWPVLRDGPVAWLAPSPGQGPAAAAMRIDPAEALPAIELDIKPEGRPPERWTAVKSLLDADGEARVFVLEPEDDGTAHLLFGDGRHGRRPDPGARVGVAAMKVGGGRAGTIGIGALGHILHVDPDLAGVENLTAGVGGVDPEPAAVARELVPQSWRSQERAVTVRDYAEAAAAVDGVQRAGAWMSWNGSWYAITVAVDPVGGTIGATLAGAIRDRLESLRMVGHDLRIVPAKPVPLAIAMRVCLEPGYLTGDIEQALGRLFNAGTDAAGEKGLFHPDLFRMGERFDLSPLVAAAQAIDGVSHVEVTRFERRDAPGTDGIAFGYLMPRTAEVFVVDNDPNFPDRGRFEADVRPAA